MTGAPPARDDGRAVAAVAAVVGVLVLALVALGAWLAPRVDVPAPAPRPVASAPSPAAPTQTVDASVLRLQALEDVLAARSAAVLAGDRARWLQTVDPAAADFLARQGQVFDNLAAVPLAEWRYEYAGEGPALAADRAAALGPDAWVARVVLVYRLDDPQLGEVRREGYLTLVRRGEGWVVADDADGPTAVELWDLGPVQIQRGERSLVLGNGPQEALAGYAAEADAAARRVDAVWGTGWPRTVAVLVPASQAGMARLLGRPDETGLEQIAAVTTGEVGGSDEAATGDRVVVNPEGFAQLGPVGREVVLTHEITHVATRAAGSREVPIWLSEGFADYVAYVDSGLSRAVVAEDVLARVRAGEGPAALPGEPDFDPALGEVAPAYAGAWLAADLIAERWGQDALVTLYGEVAAGTTVDAALVAVTGLTEATFTKEWQEYLAELAA